MTARSDDAADDMCWTWECNLLTVFTLLIECGHETFNGLPSSIVGDTTPSNSREKVVSVQGVHVNVGGPCF